jgi:hypothetical protein
MGYDSIDLVIQLVYSACYKWLAETIAAVAIERKPNCDGNFQS